MLELLYVTVKDYTLTQLQATFRAKTSNTTDLAQNVYVRTYIFIE